MPVVLHIMSLDRNLSKVKITISDSTVSLGWWMVMADDEQGYAPAAYLEPVEGGGVVGEGEGALEELEEAEEKSECACVLCVCVCVCVLWV